MTAQRARTGNLSASQLRRKISRWFRTQRADAFRRIFRVAENTKILDLGGGLGDHIHWLLQGTSVRPENVTVADIFDAPQPYGYKRVVLKEIDSLPFGKSEFDIVFCNSVLEHVTVPKDKIWTTSGAEFREQSLRHQRSFAEQISAITKAYWVQVPYKWFPVCSHSWLPFIAWLPRILLLPAIKTFRRLGYKVHRPDWYILTRKQMQTMFPLAVIQSERFIGLTKSLIAIRTPDSSSDKPPTTKTLAA